ncbi:MAG TPA: hypothetical protein VF445_16105 [Bordetella sp.]|uniref:hypothetical protein n=1 Tax=Bordetella sp. TaxID=28081 RepID=UPI002ED36724
MTFIKIVPALRDTPADEHHAAISGPSPPTRRLPDTPADGWAVFDLACDEPYMDGDSRQNPDFCTTHADDELRRLMDVSIDKNMSEKVRFP